MEKLQFNTTINATPEKVWSTLWDNDTYGRWTSVFSEGSRAITDWQKGSKVLFVDGNNSGMVSKIADIIPNKFMSFQHLGEMKDGIEDTESEKVKQWAGSFENYTLTDKDGKTELLVEMDTNADFKDYFMNTFPKAIEKLKELAERN